MFDGVGRRISAAAFDVIASYYHYSFEEAKIPGK